MQVNVLCSGSKGNACLIESAEALILIDCGSTKKYLVQALSKLGKSLNDIDALLVTHNHSDHVSQIRQFKDKPIYCWCPVKDFCTCIHPVEPDMDFTIKDISVHTICLSHDAGHTLGYKIQTGKETLVYITDTGYIQNSAIPVIANADYYIMESNHDVEMLMNTNRPMYLKQRILSSTGHLCNEDAAIVLSKAVGDATKVIALAHLSEEANTPQAALSCLEDTFTVKDIDTSHIKIVACSQYEIVNVA